MDRVVIDCAQKGCRKAPRWALRLSTSYKITRSCHKHLHEVALVISASHEHINHLILEHI